MQQLIEWNLYQGGTAARQLFTFYFTSYSKIYFYMIVLPPNFSP